MVSCKYKYVQFSIPNIEDAKPKKNNVFFFIYVYYNLYRDIFM